VEARLARTLLMSHDRVGRNVFPLTQDFLAMTLGVRRASVTVAAEVLQQARLIHYHHGSITICDRDGLEAASCEDYRLCKEADDRLY
jgi:CRP-like cAMP-binding protein